MTYTLRTRTKRNTVIILSVIYVVAVILAMLDEILAAHALLMIAAVYGYGAVKYYVAKNEPGWAAYQRKYRIVPVCFLALFGLHFVGVLTSWNVVDGNWPLVIATDIGFVVALLAVTAPIWIAKLILAIAWPFKWLYGRFAAQS